MTPSLFSENIPCLNLGWLATNLKFETLPRYTAEEILDGSRYLYNNTELYNNEYEMGWNMINKYGYEDTININKLWII